MDVVTVMLRRFDLASANQREKLLYGLIDRLTDQEAASLDTHWSWRQKRFDIVSTLPIELQLSLIDHLDVKDLFNCTLVCKGWRGLLLETVAVVNDLLSKRFPRLVRGSARENSRLLFQAIRHRYFRATGRFRTRLTMSWGRAADGYHLPVRLECLNRGHTYMDRLACSATPDRLLSPWIQPPRRASADTAWHYARGRFAWRPRAPLSHIVVDDFRTGQRKLFTHPQNTFVTGLNIRLIALGDRLVVGASGRRIIAWDIMSGSRSEATLPNAATRCITQGDRVLIIVRDHLLFVWESLNRLVEVDTAVPQEQAKPSPGSEPSSQPPCIKVDAGGEECVPPLFFGADQNTFFCVQVQADRLSASQQPERVLTIYEFQRCPLDNKYKASRSFCHGLGVGGSKSVWAEIREVDACGTFQVLVLQTKPVVDQAHQVRYILFNTLTTSFSVVTYQSLYVIPEPTIKSSALWEGQLVHPWFRHPGEEHPLPTLVALDPGATTHTSSLIDPTLSYVAQGGIPGVTRDSKIWPKSYRRDVVRDGAVDEESTGLPVYGSVRGFQHALSFQTVRPCTYPGAHHPSCPAHNLECILSATSRTVSPLERCGGQSDNLGSPRGLTAVRVYADEEFLVVVTNGDTYTVFCVDPDGEVAEAVENREQMETQGDSKSLSDWAPSRA